ncbi:MAG TPA: DUF948 domain-containing protein [Gemmatimonadaceae bacterium]|nr:DUF948 domain-containing protein [Gemmatimonadaceae bacterium]
MSAWSADLGLWLLQQAAVVQDTPAVKVIMEEPGWFERVSSIGRAVMTVALLVLTVALVPAAWNFRKSYKRINQLLDQVYGDIHPIMRHASVVADNVNYITTSIRVDVQQLNQTIALANQRLREAIQTTERRVQEFNALLEVVQQEAEDVFLSTASTVRGVRVGASELGRRAGAGEPAIDGADGPLDDEDLYGGLEAELEAEEEDDGHDSRDEDTGRQPTPRIRPRRRPGGPV